MKPIPLTQFEVHNFNRNPTGQIRRVIKPQPKTYSNQRWSFINPPYQPGDILWVKETWGIHECAKCMVGIPALGGVCTCKPVYKADYQWPILIKWRSPVTMPREEARLFLRVTDVRVQRVQDITSSDIEQEGVDTEGLNTGEEWKYAFSQLWDSINAKRGYGWDANPWVWAYTFEQVAFPPQKPMIQEARND